MILSPRMKERLVGYETKTIEVQVQGAFCDLCGNCSTISWVKVGKDTTHRGGIASKVSDLFHILGLRGTHDMHELLDGSGMVCTYCRENIYSKVKMAVVTDKVKEEFEKRRLSNDSK